MRDNQLPNLQDDGLPTPEVGEWAEEKYELVEMYASIFVRSMRRHWEVLFYLDLFAGAGRSRIRTTGRIVPASPLLALAQEPSFDRFVFCDSEAAKLDALRQRVRRDHSDADARFVQGDANAKTAEILEKLPQPAGGRRVLGLCFVDPYRLKDLRFETISELSGRFMDFLVLIPTGYDATRNEGIYLDPSNKILERFLNDAGWRSKWRKARAEGVTFDRFVTDSFGAAMKKLDYIYPGIDNTQLVRNTEKRARLYRLALFSRHHLGAKFWREVKRYTDPQQQLF